MGIRLPRDAKHDPLLLLLARHAFCDNHPGVPKAMCSAAVKHAAKLHVDDCTRIGASEEGAYPTGFGLVTSAITHRSTSRLA